MTDLQISPLVNVEVIALHFIYGLRGLTFVGLFNKILLKYNKIFGSNKKKKIKGVILENFKAFLNSVT